MILTTELDSEDRVLSSACGKAFSGPFKTCIHLWRRGRGGVVAFTVWVQGTKLMSCGFATSVYPLSHLADLNILLCSVFISSVENVSLTRAPECRGWVDHV